MTDIRLNVAFPRHVKTRRLRSKCKADGVLALLALWCYAAENDPSGLLDGLTEDEVESVAEWRGKRGRFVAALLDLGWLERENGGFRLHGWEEHQQYAIHAPERSAQASNAAKARWAKRGAMPDPCSEQCSQHKTSNAPSPAPSPAPNPSPTPAPIAARDNGQHKTRRKVGPQEAVAKSLAAALGSTLNPCRKQIAALVAAGRSLPDLQAAVDQHAEPGIAPWDWTKRVTGAATQRQDGGLSASEILAYRSDFDAPEDQ